MFLKRNGRVRTPFTTPPEWKIPALQLAGAPGNAELTRKGCLIESQTLEYRLSFKYLFFR